MPKYAHIKDGTVLLVKTLTDEEAANIPPHKAAYILPYIEVAQPVYNPETHYPPVRQPDDIQADQVVQTWAAPVAKTQQELDAELDAMVAQMDRNRSFTKGLARIVFKIARGDWAIPQPTLTVQQFKNQIKLASEE